jgi:Fe-S cluster biogenesis protein NfuA
MSVETTTATPTSPVAADAATADAVPAAAGVIDWAQVEKVIQVIRPAIQADNGDIHLRGVDEATGVVSVELVGACVSCPASTVTLKAGIERILRDRVPGVTEVVDVGAAGELIGEAAAAAPPAPAVPESPVSL